MSARPASYVEPLARALRHATAWLDTVPDRRVAPSATADQLLPVLGGPLPDGPTDPADVIDLLASGAEPGLMAMPSGRFFGWVIGGTLPAALAADWMVSAWDQNAGMRYATPAAAALEETAGHWLLDLLGLPPGADVGFTTGATMANFTGLAAGRDAVLRRAGWDVITNGLHGAPRLHVLVGEERHSSLDLALRYLGLGRPTTVAADDQGRIVPAALAQALQQVPAAEPVLVALQAGNLHSGAFDPFTETIALAHGRDAWVHVDGAFGLWAAATPRLEHLMAGCAGADSWATDAHKTLNVPYDCGIAIVADPAAMRAAMDVQASYLIGDTSGAGDAYGKVPELSRRARGIPVWAALRSLGRDGVRDLMDHLVDTTQAIAAGIRTIPTAEIVNEIAYTQICVSFGDDERTREVTSRLLAEGETWMSGSRWAGRDVLRVSVSNWSTDAADIDRSLASLRRAAGG